MAVTGAEPTMGVAGRCIEQREHADHRPPALLILLDEAVFHAELGVAIAELGAAAVRMVESNRRDQMHHDVRYDAVIDLDAGQRARGIALKVCCLAEG
ncbi:MAG TPA: hypothetical protein VNG52_02375, partial [Stellaceae bacterium]|nr:hypothetical protein [Stellaceae bacterium]